MPRLGEQLSGTASLANSKLLTLRPSRLRTVIDNHYTRAELAFPAIIAAYLVLGYFAALAVGRVPEVSIFHYTAGLYNFVQPVVALAVCARVAYIMVVVTPDRLSSYLASDFKAFIFNRQRLIQCVPIAVLLTFFISMYSSLKRMIPSFHPYTWDESWMLLDRFLYFGQDPWKLMQPLFGMPTITYLLNLSYNIWFSMMLAFLVWQVFTIKNRFLRMQYLYTFVLIWSLGGNVLASVFASAGPCFYDAFVGGLNPYSGLMEYLQHANNSYEIWALTAQEFLLNKYTTLEEGMGVGISAMPSMHVAQSTLFALLALQVHRTFGYIMLFYAVLIYLGSIHLAWHYAVDGVVGALLTILIWFAVGQFLRRDEKLCSKIESSSESQLSAS